MEKESHELLPLARQTASGWISESGSRRPNGLRLNQAASAGQRNRTCKNRGQPPELRGSQPPFTGRMPRFSLIGLILWNRVRSLGTRLMELTLLPTATGCSPRRVRTPAVPMRFERSTTVCAVFFGFTIGQFVLAGLRHRRWRGSPLTSSYRIVNGGGPERTQSEASFY